MRRRQFFGPFWKITFRMTDFKTVTRLKGKNKKATKNIPRNPLILSEWHAEVEVEV